MFFDGNSIRNLKVISLLGVMEGADEGVLDGFALDEIDGLPDGLPGAALDGLSVGLSD